MAVHSAFRQQGLILLRGRFQKTLHYGTVILYLTVSRLRGTHLGTLSDFVRLLSKNDSLEEQKV